jgi:hypothetical protein
MAKKKAEKPPVPKKKERTYTMPVEHLEMIADRILTTAPTKVIILNTLKDVWQNGRDYGYFGRIREARVFNDKREKIIKETFDGLQDLIDDNIHSRSNNENK